MIRTIAIWSFSILAVLFGTLALHRLTLDYNENGVYLKEGVTFDSDAITTFATLSIINFLLAIGVRVLNAFHNAKHCRGV